MSPRLLQLADLSRLALINTVNLYLDPAQAEQRTQLIALSNSKDPQANSVIAGYVREALRKFTLSHAPEACANLRFLQVWTPW